MKCIYSIYDKVAKEFGPVFEAKNDNVAARMFVTEIPEEVRKRLNDYSLYNLGNIDHESGMIIPKKEEVELVVDESKGDFDHE